MDSAGARRRWSRQAISVPSTSSSVCRPRCAAVEAFTRLRDVQSQVRSVVAKQETARIAVLILVIAGTHTNRRALGEAGALLRHAFPLSTRAVLGTLRRGEIPQANEIVLI